MRGYFGLGQLSATEKQDILNQHKSLYNGYQTMQPKVSNEQPLYVYDFAGDKDGMVVNNKGEVKKYTNMGINEQVKSKNMCEQCGGVMKENVCEQCGPSEEIEENVGKLDDIYKVKDLNLTKGDFDYVEGGGNDYGTFEKAHHMKKMKNEQSDDDDYMDYESSYTEDGMDDPDNEDDGFEDMNLDEIEDFISSLDEQGGNADDMDVDDVEDAYNFVSNGPGDVYPVNEDDMYGYEPEKTYETMESAWADEEIDEQDVSGSQGIYGDMEKAYDFDSDGPGKGGPYQEFSYESELDEEDEEDSDDEEWEEIDVDMVESFITQKNKITEMFNRIGKFN